jgi:hypothetical protein
MVKRFEFVAVGFPKNLAENRESLDNSRNVSINLSLVSLSRGHHWALQLRMLDLTSRKPGIYNRPIDERQAGPGLDPRSGHQPPRT